MKIKKEPFGILKNHPVYEYTLTNSQHLSLSILSYGGIITKIKMPDRNGKIEDITINVDDFDQILNSRPFHGALIGPVTGRISKGFYIDGNRKVELEKNEGPNTLHSGTSGFDTKLWDIQALEKDNEITLILNAQFKDGDGGFPGNIDVRVCYSLNEDNEISITYEAQTDKRTLFNPTNHVYFNLSGDYQKPIYNHQLQLQSDKYAVLNEDNTPTGELRAVDATDFDFRTGKKLDFLSTTTDQQIITRGGFDHPFVLSTEKLKNVATLSDEKSGRILEMSTDADAMVVYTHNHEQTVDTSENKMLEKHSGIALETSSLPDAVNHEHFGSIWLDKDEVFKSQTIYTFSLK